MTWRKIEVYTGCALDIGLVQCTNWGVDRDERWLEVTTKIQNIEFHLGPDGWAVSRPETIHNLSKVQAELVPYVEELAKLINWETIT